MGAFDEIWIREKLIKKTIEIDNKLYEELRNLSDNKYDASVNKLINASIMELAKTENVGVYAKDKDEIGVKHSLLIRESLVKELDRLRDKYDISIYKIVNIAIKNAITQIK